MGPTSPAPDAYPDWDGVPRDELPLRPIFGLDLLVILKQRFPDGETVAEILNWGTVHQIRGGEIVVGEDQSDAMVRLWVPAFEDQRTENRERDESTDHLPIAEGQRWFVAERALGTLAAAQPGRAVHLGFLTGDGSAYMLPWREYCQHYPHPPEFAFGYWEYEEE
jgi:hypothetical protein